MNVVKDAACGVIAFVDEVRYKFWHNRVLLTIANLVVWGACIHFAAGATP